MSGDHFHYGHDMLGTHWGWVNVEKGGGATADEVIAALCADVKMLRDSLHSLRILTLVTAWVFVAVLVVDAARRVLA